MKTPKQKRGLTNLEILLGCFLILFLAITALIVFRARERPEADRENIASAADETATVDNDGNDDIERDPAFIPKSVAQHSKSKPVPVLGGTNGSPALPLPAMNAPSVAKTGSTNSPVSTPKPAAPATAAAPAQKTKTAPASSKAKKAAKPSSIAIREPPPDLASLLEEIENKTWSVDTERQLLDVIKRWAGTDPVSAFAYAIDIKRRTTRTTALGNVMTVWSRQSPEAACDWLKMTAANNPSLIEGQTRTVFNSLVSGDIGLAAERIWSLPTDNMKKMALEVVAGKLIALGRENEVIALYDGLTKSTDKGLVADVLLRSSIVRYQPQKLAPWAAGITDPKARSAALDTFVAVWAYEHPAAAGEWVALELPADADRARQIGKVVDAWVREDPVNAADWLLSLFPPSGQTDAGVCALARAVMAKNPEPAATWSFTVTDRSLRWKLMEEIAARWGKTDRQQARLFIQSTDLPKATKNRLLK